MEILTLRYEALCKALASLKDSIELIESYPATDNDRIHAAFRDSCIQRFEYSFDAFWKFLKLYLENHEGIDVQGNTPRFVFKLAHDKKILIDDKNYEIFLQALPDRNLTSHSYNVQTAEKIMVHIPVYYQAMTSVAHSLYDTML